MREAGSNDQSLLRDRSEGVWHCMIFFVARRLSWPLADGGLKASESRKVFAWVQAALVTGHHSEAC